jgi:GNAT superfamily N-acetyltransferase
MMTRAKILSLYDQDQRQDVEYPDARREAIYRIGEPVGEAGLSVSRGAGSRRAAGGEEPALVRHVGIDDQNPNGAVLYSRLDVSTVDAAIREQIAYFEELRQDFEWKVYGHDRPADLKERLAAYGFEVEEAEAVMVLDIHRAPRTLLRPAGESIRRITTSAMVDEVMAVQSAVWGEEDAGVERYLKYTLDRYPELMSVYLAYVDGQAVSAGWIYFPPGSQFASLWGGSTRREYRGRGLYTALVAVRLQEARQRQVRYLTVDASPMSRPILEKLGFERIAYAYACQWKVGRA